jgi:hypothetical protein
MNEIGGGEQRRGEVRVAFDEAALAGWMAANVEGLPDL